MPLLALAVVLASLVVTTDPAAAHAPHDYIHDVTMSPAYSSDSTVLAISRTHLMRSTNQGVTWKEVTRGLDRRDVVRLASAASDKNRLYALNNGRGVYRSNDQGLSWAPTARPGNLTTIADVVVSPASA